MQHRAMLLFASFQGQSVSHIALLYRASPTHVAELIHAFSRELTGPVLDVNGGARFS